MRIVILIVALLAFGVPYDGHRGRPIEGAVRAEIRPVSPYDGPLALKLARLGGEPVVKVNAWLKNVSNGVVLVRGCVADAIDGDGSRLFTINPYAGTAAFLLLPGAHSGTRSISAVSRSAAPAGVTHSDVLNTVRYDARCDVYSWVGPLPRYSYD